MAGLDPAIHAFAPSEDVDARHKAGHDGGEKRRPGHASFVYRDIEFWREENGF
jgi:hypothetical protein